MKCLFDSGCGRTVFPQDADHGVVSKAANSCEFTTASGEKVKSGDAYRVCGTDEYGLNLALNGLLTDVRKPLISGGGVTGKGHDVFMSDSGSYIIWRTSPAYKEIREAVTRILKKHKYVGTTNLYKENSVYNFYLKVSRSDSVSEQTENVLCPATPSINRRQGRSL